MIKVFTVIEKIGIMTNYHEVNNELEAAMLLKKLLNQGAKAYIA